MKWPSLLALVVAIALAVPAYAEVQNVSVSGDLTVHGFVRDDYDLSDGSQIDTDALGNRNPNEPNETNDNLQHWFQQHVGVNVDADLTDNVSTHVRLVNQRNWDASNVVGGAAAVNNFEVLLGEAYVTLKELLYSPLTVRIGRQPIWFGRGFVIGSALQDPENLLGADEYTSISGFDAIRATFDYSPMIVDVVYLKSDENVISTSDDQTLWGANFSHTLSTLTNGVAEAYFWYDRDKNNANTPTNNVFTLGGRGQYDPAADFTVGLETAFQFGDYGAVAGRGGRERLAWGVDTFAEYTWQDATWTPKLGFEYIFYSGEEDTAATTQPKKRWNGWDPVRRGKFDSAIRDFQNFLYATVQRGDNVAATIWDQDGGLSNEHQYAFYGTAQPMEDLSLTGRFTYFRFAEPASFVNNVKDIGVEFDMTGKYNYTEDVSFDLLYAWFIPGGYWGPNSDDSATSLVGSMKVSF